MIKQSLYFYCYSPEGSDFLQAAGQLQLGLVNGTMSRDITIQILEDSIFERELEYFTLLLETESTKVHIVNAEKRIYVRDNEGTLHIYIYINNFTATEESKSNITLSQRLKKNPT